MKNFCTNCGHANERDNRVCVECGASLTEEKQKVENSSAAAQPIKNKKPLSLKTKVLSLLGIIVVASLIGVYTWGSKAASADTVVAKFFEALQNEDAKALSKQAILSDGREMSDKEAAAFIELYRDISPNELEAVARVEKNGKVIGIFDAHRVIIPAEKLSFSFPHEGLALNLNGELITAAEHTDGEYIFSGISPGLQKAEFIYEGEFTEFTYPFELEAYMYGDSSVIDSIYVDLPVSSVIFGLDTMNSEDPDANKVIIGEKEVPVNEYGETEEIGPLLLDGSLTAQAEVEFPWGTQLSEPVEITSNYQLIEFSGLEDKQQEALIEQLNLFSEEFVQALGTRDSTVFTTVTKEQLEVLKEDIQYMEEYEDLFMGSLSEVGVDEESITILTDGKTVTLNAEMQIEGDYYYSSEKPESELMEVEASIDFIFDGKSEKWMINSYNEGANFEDVIPTATYEGSGKLHQKAFASATVKEESGTDEDSGNDSGNEYIGFDKESATGFMNEYNNASVKAINSGDITYVSRFIYDSGPRYKEQSDFIDYMYSKGIMEEHLSTSVESVKHLGEEFHEVVTIEKFIIHGTENSSEKTYRTVTKVRVDLSGAAVYELISTTEI